jgi:diguanylate cyclase (GGDEF)-like protein
MTDKNKRARILVIDDAPTNLHVLTAVLSAEFQVQIATSGAIALELATKYPPDLILLDVMMPEMNGFEVCKRLRAVPALTNIPVIFITALSDSESQVAGLALGAADYISKPFKVEIVKLRIRNLLERQHLREQIEEKQAELERIAKYDPLTGLPNRALLADRMSMALLQTQRRGQKLAVAFVDLDGFKAVNDSHGHDAGDHLLITLARRMKQALRDGDTLARLGGDEFVAVLVDLADVDASAPMLNRLLAAVAQPVHFGQALLQVSASLGITFYPQAQEIDAEQLIRQADQAMYQAKLAGKNRFCVFNAEQDRSVRAHHESMQRMERALGQGEFVLEYQPKVNLRSGKVTGVEALIRWIHPERGILPPADFLPMIEDHALAIELGQWVIESALQQIGRWQRAGLNMQVSVNISTHHLQQRDFVERLRSTLEAHPGLPQHCLELELLESGTVGDLARVSGVLKACQQMGVRFALDDFGTGSASLIYLKRLPVSQLKIDQSFVSQMLGNPDDLAILESIVGLAKAFDIEVLAEGVETVAHGVQLLQLGCELAQGYAIAPPMPAGEIPLWVENWQPDPAWALSPARTSAGCD